MIICANCSFKAQGDFHASAISFPPLAQGIILIPCTLAEFRTPYYHKKPRAISLLFESVFSSHMGTFLYFGIFILAGHFYTSCSLGQTFWADVTRTDDIVIIPESYIVWHDDVFFYIFYFFLNNS